MSFNWDSQIGGVIIGAILAGVFSLIGGWTTLFIQGRRMEKQLEHDAKARESQFAHDRQQELRGRRTEALADLQEALEEQAEALVWLRTIYKNNKSQLRGQIEKSDKWVVLYPTFRTNRIRLFAIFRDEIIEEQGYLLYMPPIVFFAHSQQTEYFGLNRIEFITEFVEQRRTLHEPA